MNMFYVLKITTCLGIYIFNLKILSLLVLVYKIYRCIILRIYVYAKGHISIR